MVAAVGPVVSSAIGTNPRAVKRFLNILDLLTCVYASADARDETAWADDTSVFAMLGLVALQARWPAVAAHLSAIDDPDQLVRELALLGSDSKDDPARATLLERLLRENGDTRDPGEVDDLTDFIDGFRGLLDGNDDQQLAAKELEPLQQWAAKLRLTGVGRKNVERDVGERFAERVRQSAPDVAGDYLRLTAQVWDRWREHWDVLDVVRHAHEFDVQANIGNGRFVRVFVFGANGQPKLGKPRLGQPYLDQLCRLREAFLGECQAEGLEWEQVRGAWVLKPGALSGARWATFRTKLHTFFDEVDRLALTWKEAGIGSLEEPAGGLSAQDDVEAADTPPGTVVAPNA